MTNAITTTNATHIEGPAAQASTDAPPITVLRHKTWAHLLEYPTVLEVHKSMESSKWIRPWKIPLMDSLETVSTYQPFKFVYETGDRLADSGLDVLDGFVPSLKTMEFQDVTNLVTQPMRSLHLIVTKGVVEPAAKSIHDTRVFVHSAVSDRKATKVAKSVANPVAGTFNSMLDSTCLLVLPSIDLEPVGEMSELRKTKVKVTNIVTFKKKATETAQPGPDGDAAGSAAN